SFLSRRSLLALLVGVVLVILRCILYAKRKLVRAAASRAAADPGRRRESRHPSSNQRAGSGMVADLRPATARFSDDVRNCW
ncbi:MAG TPA: hypothetical protein VFQ06_04360, partial [Nitrospira sp.]|nr:hypothetical protein [Nitrospira sp.]